MHGLLFGNLGRLQFRFYRQVLLLAILEGLCRKLCNVYGAVGSMSRMLLEMLEVWVGCRWMSMGASVICSFGKVLLKLV